MKKEEIKECLEKILAHCESRECATCELKNINEWGDEECLLNLFNGCSIEYIRNKIQELKI